MDLKKIILRYTTSKNFKEIFLSSSLSFVFKVLNYLLGFLYIFVIARFFTLEVQGTFTIVYTILSLAVLISKFGINTSIIKWMSIFFHENKDGKAKYIYFKGYYITVIFSIVISATIFSTSDIIANSFFHKSGLVYPIRIISISIPFLTTTEMVSSFFLARNKILLYSFYLFTAKFLLPILLFGFLVLCNYTEELIPIYTYSIGIIITGVFALFHVCLSNKKIKSVTTDLINFKKIINVSFPLLLSSSLVMIMWWSDTFILGVYGTEEEVGVYNVAVKIASITTFVYSAISAVLQPKIANYYKSADRVGLENILNYSAKVIMLTSLPIVIMLVIFSKFFLSIFGEEYIQGQIIMLLLLVAQFANTATGPVGAFLSMTGNEKIQFRIILVSLILNLVISLYLVSEYKGVGVAIGSAIGMIFWNVAGAIYIKLTLGYQTWFKF